MHSGKRDFDPGEAALRIKAEALRLGFSACGIAKVHSLSDDAVYLQQWLNAGHNGKMGYLSNHADKRQDISLLVPRAQSVIVVLLNYATPSRQMSKQFTVAKYAHGFDYHYVIKQYLEDLLRFICKEIAPAEGRAFCDSAPLFERRWAYEAGLGWIGMNHCLIHPEFGSFCLIGELVIDLELQYDSPLAGDCGYCGRCISACPTKAIQSKGFLAAEKCISYLTVELKDVIPDHFHHKLKGSIVGCDRCQDICPWNKRATEFTSPLWRLDSEIMAMTDDDWKLLDKSSFKREFGKSALTRLGYRKLRQNCDIVLQQDGNEAN